MKEFTSPTPRTEPIPFKLNDQVFTCKPEAPSSLKMLRDARAIVETQDGGIAAKVILEFYETVMEPEEYARFSAYCDAPDVVVNLQLLVEIMQWLVGEYSARPTSPSSP